MWAVLVVALAAGRVVASDLVDFARCISRAGATFYTAAWCPHCARQMQMFGNAVRYLHVVDCTDGCRGVSSFPTWSFADGSRISGVASFDALGRRTRCRLGTPREGEPNADGPTRSSTERGARERYVGGAQIIDVPRR